MYRYRPKPWIPLGHQLALVYSSLRADGDRALPLAEPVPGELSALSAASSYDGSAAVRWPRCRPVWNAGPATSSIRLQSSTTFRLAMRHTPSDLRSAST